HSRTRKMLYRLFALYQLLQAAMGWVLVGHTYLIFLVVAHHELVSRVQSDNVLIRVCVHTPNVVYVLLLVSHFVYALGNSDVKALSGFHRVTAFLWAPIFGLFLFMSALLLSELLTDDDEPVWLKAVFVTSVSLLFGSPFVAALMQNVLGCVRLLAASVGYVALLPYLLNALPIFAIAHLHDVSWGNRGGKHRATAAAVASAAAAERQRAQLTGDSDKLNRIIEADENLRQADPMARLPEIRPQHLHENLPKRREVEIRAEIVSATDFDALSTGVRAVSAALQCRDERAEASRQRRAPHNNRGADSTNASSDSAVVQKRELPQARWPVDEAKRYMEYPAGPSESDLQLQSRLQ
ncbi:MAG: hypothetical protein MHM6MM_006943, partial [Cercozoa sp. M6MM]